MISQNIYEIDTLLMFHNKGYSLAECVVQGLNFEDTELEWEKMDVKGTVFLGCRFPSLAVEFKLRAGGALLFPPIENLPYNPYRSTLYNWRELMQMTPEGITYDEVLYDHFVKHNRHCPDIIEGLAQRIHDHAIDDALGEILVDAETGRRKRTVGIMGAHGALRTDLNYQKVAETAYLLARDGYFIVSGGGPGIMEAANLGAYLSQEPFETLQWAIETLSVAPYYTDAGYIEAAMTVIEHFPHGNQNLAIPTWFYGHEPSNLFATAIAKYFSNSLREDGLLAICLYGIIFAPGSAGTRQEIFQDATQNHYGTFDYFSPMVFLDQDFYKNQTALYPLLQLFAENRVYGDMLHITDSPSDVLDFIRLHPPVKKS
ncbi:MAG: hypothetical protein R3E32_25955 [Chitinophagales bacterium]